jgi:hypothetical protein|tara:strand:+ start:176 stop:505 length:330 start_codon:yes stop_codon:yes gene_type:complete
MNITLERIENASKDIIYGFDGTRKENRGAKEALEMLIRHFKELEESGEKSFNITWSEEDIEIHHPEIPEEHRAKVLQMFEDKLKEEENYVWVHMLENLDGVCLDYLENV